MAPRRSSFANDCGSSIVAGTSLQDAIEVDDTDNCLNAGACVPRTSARSPGTSKESVSVPSEDSSATTKTKRGGRPKGKLRKVPEMPLDILFNVNCGCIVGRSNLKTLTPRTSV
jgi:hypothetical protein